MSKNYTVEYYKGYGIDYNIYGMNEYSFQYCGDDIFARSLEEAKQKIDNLETR